ncbi:MAG: hypothetical protein KME07_05550 [Pegethrix bostrychoides GSE-TBD4-15B]|uniref:Uncharacterized protein n=1 Tax=Pegethrix bostrychoides GSE-TBD4-15B TaxID=2839662 RepID=A0A951PA31_9CYAN|nr:hypothetical protein [Pegethrix bostrychoides GSE-TBD4-15B]
MTSRSRKAANPASVTQPPLGCKPKRRCPTPSQPIPKRPELDGRGQAVAPLPSTIPLPSGPVAFLSAPLTRWVLCPALAAITITGSIGTYLYRGIQTYRYYDWTILPVSDTRLEAACGELTLYYMSWQNPKSDKPIGHVVNAAELSQCAASQETPTPAARFPGLGNKAVLSQLGCKPESGSIERATAWNCIKPVGKLLRSEIELSSRAKQP